MDEILTKISEISERLNNIEYSIETLEYSMREHQHTAIDSTSKLKQVLPNIQRVTTASTITPTNLNDCVDVTALASAVTIANFTGTPFNFQKLIIRIKDNGTARALTWGSNYVAGGVTLPSTTILSKILTLGFIYNTANSLNKYQLVASAQE